ncbi:MAG: hypothetical protein LBP58_07510 [Azoarcus sp.]|jgi:hypothetical protein|nr:hypothetical protein [Azoarcus sp.]
MLTLAEHSDFPFFDACDETRAIARAYGAVCTPGFFGNDREPKLRYRGGLNAAQEKPIPLEIRRGPSGRPPVFHSAGNETSQGAKAKVVGR